MSSKKDAGPSLRGKEGQKAKGTMKKEETRRQGSTESRLFYGRALFKFSRDSSLRLPAAGRLAVPR
jgi:hypothetical protein